jgi:Cu+-exporting ATPase
MEKDLVCGMQLEKEAWAGSYDYKGKTYHFCSVSCRDQFTKHPEDYIK